jgi:hypothetical protein
MRKLILVGVLLLAGCQGVVGPLDRARMKGPVDDPRLPISEQMRNGRDRLAYPDDVEPVEAPRSLEPPATNRYGR